MARDLTTNFVTAIESDVVRPFFAAKFEFATVTVRAWTGYGNITINSEVYKGVGTFGQINTVAETTETKAVSQDFILSGIPKENLSLALKDNYTGKTVTLFLGLFDSNRAVVSDVHQMFKGFIDTITIDEGADTARMRIRAENRLIQLERSIEKRFTEAQQKADFSGDEGFSLLDELQDKDVVWKEP